MSGANSDKRRNKCVCNWKDCREIQSALKEIDDIQAGIAKIGLTTNPKSQALRRSIDRHLKTSNETQALSEGSCYYVARHHWSRELLEHNKCTKTFFSTPLSKQTAKQLGIYDPADLYTEEKVEPGANEIKSLQAPMNAHKIVVAYIQRIRECQETSAAHSSNSKRRRFEANDDLLDETVAETEWKHLLSSQGRILWRMESDLESLRQENESLRRNNELLRQENGQLRTTLSTDRHPRYGPPWAVPHFPEHHRNSGQHATNLGKMEYECMFSRENGKGM